jgi:uncharacterized short protein YbdD (DUF466 family)
MEAHLIRKELWGLVTCEMDMDGKTESEIEAIWEDWRKKRSKKKIADAYAEMVLRVEDLQLAHMRSRDPETIWDTLAQVHRARGLATRLALRRKFLTSVKGVETMSAWVGHVKSMSHRLEDVGVDVSEEDTILALTMGLDKSYDSFIISLDTTPPEQLTLEHVISRMLNEEVRRDNVDIQGVPVGVKGRSMNGEKGEVRVKKEENVAMATTQRDGPTVCWRCGKPGHVKAFCKEKPIRGQGSDQANMAIGIDSDDEYLTEMTDSE